MDKDEFDPGAFAVAVGRLDEAMAAHGWNVASGFRGSVLFVRPGRLIRLVDLDSAEGFAASELFRLQASESFLAAWHRVHNLLHPKGER